MKRLLAIVLSLSAVFLFSCGTGIPAGLAQSDYFAITDAEGDEYVYKPGEPMFEAAVTAFASAKKTETPPPWLGETDGPLLLEWIQGGYARQFTLYLSPTHMAAYIQDSERVGYALSATAVRFFLEHETAASALQGGTPPTATVNGTPVPFSICEWLYSGTLDGSAYTVASPKYLNGDGKPHPIDPAAFVCMFGEAPVTLTYTLYRGDTEVAHGATYPPVPAEPGYYQLVVVAEWVAGNCTTRAGYFFDYTVT